MGQHTGLPARPKTGRVTIFDPFIDGGSARPVFGGPQAGRAKIGRTDLFWHPYSKPLNLQRE